MSASTHAVVTGASSGIGAAVTAALLTGGSRVTGLCRTRPMEAAGLSWVPADLTDTARLPELLDGVGPVDTIVHAAGVQRSAPLGALGTADGELMWRLQVQAATVLVNALAGRLRDGGRVVLIGSRTAGGAAGKSQYAATKAAQYALARS